MEPGDERVPGAHFGLLAGSVVLARRTGAAAASANNDSHDHQDQEFDVDEKERRESFALTRNGRPGDKCNAAGQPTRSERRTQRARHRRRDKSEPRSRRAPPLDKIGAGHKIPTVALLVLLALAFAPPYSQRTSLIQAFNVDTQSALVFSGPQGSYFGYSVAQHRDRGANWLLVGAPKAQTDQPRTKQTGAVYRCPPSGKACQQLAFDPNGSSSIMLRDQQVQSDDKSHQWFGASLASADNGSILACAPRYVYYSTNLKRRDPVGTCWVSRGSFSGFLEYSPCRLNEQWGHHHLGSCQAGFSSAITKDGGKIFMGAPGSHVWQGQVFAHNLRSDLTNSTRWENPHSEDDSYLGYSLATGRFSAAAALHETDLAIGMPRGNDLAGKVMIVDRELKTLRNLTGEQLGAYFGYSLATIDVNGDGLDDLAVGAPLFYNETLKEPHFDRGRVYVFQQNARHDFTLVQRIDGQKSRSRFGTALANCGDLNRDGFQDLAVGAPYDGPEGHGAVYIFMGGRKGSQAVSLSDEFDQVIYAEQVRGEGPNLRSFGFALSGGLDQDNNQYPDLLVGDYQADRAVLLRTRPVINVTTLLQFQPEHFNLDDKTCLLPNSNQSVPCITVQYCTKYTGSNETRLGFVYDIKLDADNRGAPRLFFLSNENKTDERTSFTLTKDVNQCKTFKAYLTKQIRDKLTPLKINIDYNLADSVDTYDYNTGQLKLKPVLNRLPGGNEMSKTATIQKNCGYDNVCIPDLKLTVDPNFNQYTIGSNEKLILNVTVKNNGEDAYESMFYLTMPTSINYKTYDKPPSDYPVCFKPDQAADNVVICDLGNPQQRNSVVKFSIITEPASGQFNSPDFTFVAQVNSTNPEQDDRHREDNQVAIGIPIRVDAQFELSGNSQPPSVEHNVTRYRALQPLDQNGKQLEKPAPKTEADVGQEVQHHYQIENRGPSTIYDIAVTIFWPSKTKEGDHLLYLVDEPITSDKVRCKVSPDGTINPLKLKYLRGNSRSMSLGKNYNSQYNNNETSASTLRLFKRQSSGQEQSDSVAQYNQLQPQTMTQKKTAISFEDPDLQQQYRSFCESLQCTHFQCNVYNLVNNEVATIKIRSRLFEETINKLSKQEPDPIASLVVAQVKSLPYNASTVSMRRSKRIETQVHTTGISVRDLLPWWLIILAILLGIGLFILLVSFLKYLGFFTRRRPPRGAEREPLTPTMWNDYQYTPGDTAL